MLHLLPSSSNRLRNAAQPGRRPHPAICGAVAEWSKALAWKVSIRQNRIEGSNPSRSATESASFAAHLISQRLKSEKRAELRVSRLTASKNHISEISPPTKLASFSRSFSVRECRSTKWPAAHGFPDQRLFTGQIVKQAGNRPLLAHRN